MVRSRIILKFKMISNYFVFGFILVLCLTNFRIINARKTCKIDLRVNLHEENSPIIVSLDDSESTPKYVYPTLKDPENILIPAGRNVNVFCPGKTNRKSTEVVEPGALKISNNKLKPSRQIENIECAAQNGKIKVGHHANANKNNVVSLNNVHCEEVTEGAILRKVDRECGSGQVYEISYDLGDDMFLKTIDLCHDESEARTLWAHAVIVPVNQEEYRHKGSGANCKSFKTGQLYEGIHMASKGPYNLVNQFQVVLNLFDDNEKVADKYSSVSTKDRKYLAKGHLIARADKFYKSEQDSTYFYANVVPMWHQINANPGNWFFVEEYIRKLALEKDSDIDVWAGGIGILELTDGSNRKKINKGQSKHKKLLKLDKIPVPKVLFKCAVDKTHEEGICFLVINNPYLTITEIEKSVDEYVVCEKYDRCEEINSNYDETTLGYFYCCGLADFYDKFKNELGLEDFEEFENYKEMSLFTGEY